MPLPPPVITIVRGESDIFMIVPVECVIAAEKLSRNVYFNPYVLLSMLEFVHPECKATPVIAQLKA